MNGRKNIFQHFKCIETFTAKGLSQFAQRRAEYHKKIHSQASPTTSTDTTIAAEAPPIKFILGNIVERRGDADAGGSRQSMMGDDNQPYAIPKPSRIDKNVILPNDSLLARLWHIINSEFFALRWKFRYRQRKVCLRWRNRRKLQNRLTIHTRANQATIISI